MRPDARIALVAIGLAFGCAGCAGLFLESGADLTAEVVSVSAVFPTDESGEMALKLRLKNPGTAKVTVLAVSWELWLDGRWFASGTQGMSMDLLTGEASLDAALPLVFLKTPLRKGPRWVRAAVRGSVSVAIERAPGREVRFERVSRITLDRVPVPKGLAGEAN